MSKLVVENISIGFVKHHQLLSETDFYCHSQEIVGVFGRNGSGKSTLFKMIFGVEKAGSIMIKIDDRLIPRQRIIPSCDIGLLPQDHFLPKTCLVKNIIPLFYPSGDDQNKIFYSKRINLLENKQIGTLSEGELKYLELLLIGNLGHNFLILDEPFSMVEPLYRDVIKEFLFEIKKKKGIVISDHYYEDVLALADRSYLINDQKLVEINGINELIENDYINCCT